MELLQHITEVVKESPTIIVYLVAGLLLLFAGLYVFKGVQFAICAVIGGLIGLAIVDVAGRNDLYYLAAIPALAGISAKLCSWFSYSRCLRRRSRP